jgi:pimeloyl-ACP methyl ester carboxylesterase
MDEPPLFASRVDPSERDQLDRLLQQSDLDRALGRFLRAYADAQDDELSFLSSLPDVWSRLLQGTQTLGRELDAVSGDVVSALTAPSIPTLALRGADTTCPNFPKAEELLSLFPGIEISQIPGQRHLAMAFAPDAVKTRLTEFWDRVSA